MGKTCVIEVLYTECLRGDGTYDNPLRQVLQLWTRGGQFIDEYDPMVEQDGSPAWTELREDARG